jgi:hypothetical protein
VSEQRHVIREVITGEGYRLPGTSGPAQSTPRRSATPTAVDVYLGGEFDATGDCGRRGGGAPVDGVCTFCGDTIDHELCWRAERRLAARPSGRGTSPKAGGARCTGCGLADPFRAARNRSSRSTATSTSGAAPRPGYAPNSSAVRVAARCSRAG